MQTFKAVFIAVCVINIIQETGSVIKEYCSFETVTDSNAVIQITFPSFSVCIYDADTVPDFNKLDNFWGKTYFAIGKFKRII